MTDPSEREVGTIGRPPSPGAVPGATPTASHAAGALELRDIHKSFGQTRANDGVTLSMDAGAIHGLLGENGAGKSTLMKILSGYISADSGEIVLGGTPLSLSSPRDATRAGIGMLHQDPLVF